MANVRTEINRQALTRLVNTAGLQAAQPIAERIAARARQTAPVRTGGYRDSITTRRSQTASGEPAIQVGATVPYAPFVEADTGNIVRATSAAR